ncbi:MAG: DUF1836 domain-containing protein [Anaeroplasmataceae bacterium]
MKDVNKTISNWLDELSEFNYPSNEQLPDIDLYMDQVITYIEKYLNLFSTSTLDKTITSSMINNYVKGKVVTAPKAKKYNKAQLSQINEIHALKQILTIAEIKQIFDTEHNDETTSNDYYNEFINLNKLKNEEVINETKTIMDDLETNDITGLTNLALNLAITANSYITISKRILFYLKKYEDIKQANKELEKAENK